MPPQLAGMGQGLMRMLGKLPGPISTAQAIGGLVFAPQESEQEVFYGQDDMVPSARVPNRYNSYELLGMMAQERQRAYQKVAKDVRAAGGTTKDVHDMFRKMTKQNMYINPGDVLRGAGRVTPKKGNIAQSNLVLVPHEVKSFGKPLPRMPSNPEYPSFTP
jgi:hypothetical protein